MADEKITQLVALASGSVQADDLLVVVDVHDTSMAPTGTDKNLTLTALLAALPALGQSSGIAVYGDGSDGSPTFDGAATILGLVPSANIYTLTRDLFLASPTINPGVTIATAGWRIYVSGTITNNGTISHDGLNGVAQTRGAGVAVGSILNTSAFGGNGGTANGTAGQTAGNSFGGAGGAGGNAGANTGGVGGSASTPVGGNATLLRGPGAYMAQGVIAAVGVAPGSGSGGGGGAGDGAVAGGGGGSGGGIVHLCARAIAGTGAIHARGGAGAVRGSGNTGGGGGGGGGTVLIISTSVVAGAVPGQTIDCAAGTAGAGTGTGLAGAAGSAGTILALLN
jgi:hypothetical protein